MLAAAAAALLALPASAQDFAEGSEAKEWGLFGEEKARFEAEVVDLLCEFTGDCPDDCGGGARQLGLKRTADGVLVLPTKNAQPIFTGAAVELAPFCGRTVEVDGLLVGEEGFVPTKFYLVQRIRADGGDWVAATGWSKRWNAAHPDLAAGEGQWFRKDPRVNAHIEESGYLGLGLETDAEFKAYLFE